MLGIYLSGHPLDDYLDKYKDFNLTSDMLVPNEDVDSTYDEDDGDDKVELTYSSNITDGMSVTCGGIINSIKKVYTRNSNKEMAVLLIEDLYGTFETMLFPKVYEKYKSILEEDAMITICGKLSLRDGESPIITADTVSIWHDKNEAQNQIANAEEKLYLKFDTKNTKIYNKIMLILSVYSGSCPVVCKCTSTNQSFKINKMVNPNNILINELIGVLDESSVVLVRKEK